MTRRRYFAGVERQLHLGSLVVPMCLLLLLLLSTLLLLLQMLLLLSLKLHAHGLQDLPTTNTSPSHIEPGLYEETLVPKKQQPHPHTKCN